MKLQLIICHQNELLFCFFFYKTRGNTQEVLPVVQTYIFYRYDEWMVREINDITLTEVNRT